MRNILVINGHPDPRPERFCAALCTAYREGAAEGGWPVRHLSVGTLVPLVPNNSAEARDDVEAAHQAITWADRMLIVFPLWLDQAPIMLKGFFSRIVAWQSANCPSARIAISPTATRAIVTMEMPAIAHRAASRQPARGKPALVLPGLDIPSPTFIGSVRHLTHERRARWIDELHTEGLRGV